MEGKVTRIRGWQTVHFMSKGTSLKGSGENARGKTRGFPFCLQSGFPPRGRVDQPFLERGCPSTEEQNPSQGQGEDTRVV